MYKRQVQGCTHVYVKVVTFPFTETTGDTWPNILQIPELLLLNLIGFGGGTGTSQAKVISAGGLRNSGSLAGKTVICLW